MKSTRTLSTHEFSIQTGLSITTITKMLRSGQISGHKHSGKWRIPEDQLHTKAVAALHTRSSAAINPLSSKKNKSLQEFPDQDYSISEFSRMTYLTEFGIQMWLKDGKLKGHQDSSGQWRIDSECLNAPNLQHLLRK